MTSVSDSCTKMSPLVVLVAISVPIVVSMSAVPEPPIPDDAVSVRFFAVTLAASPVRLSVIAPPDAVIVTVPLVVSARMSLIAALPVPPTVMATAVAVLLVV